MEVYELAVIFLLSGIASLIIFALLSIIFTIPKQLERIADELERKNDKDFKNEKEPN